MIEVFLTAVLWCTSNVKPANASGKDKTIIDKLYINHRRSRVRMFFARCVSVLALDIHVVCRYLIISQEGKAIHVH